MNPTAKHVPKLARNPAAAYRFDRAMLASKLDYWNRGIVGDVSAASNKLPLARAAHAMRGMQAGLYEAAAYHSCDAK